MRILRALWWRLIARRYVTVERFRQEHRAYVAAEARYLALVDWIENVHSGKRGGHSPDDLPNYTRIAREAWEYALRCVPLDRSR